MKSQTAHWHKIGDNDPGPDGIQAALRAAPVIRVGPRSRTPLRSEKERPHLPRPVGRQHIGHIITIVLILPRTSLKGGKPPLDSKETATAAAAAAGSCAPQCEDKPAPARARWGGGLERETIYTIVLELRVSCVRPVAAANSQLSGGLAGRGQQETNQWAKLYTGISWYIGRHGLLKQSYTVASLYVLAYTLLEHHIPS